MFGGQGNRPPWEQQAQGFNGGRRGSGPPPAKRSKSGPGPVITYYPPPPGYTGPARPQGPYQQAAWAQQQPQQHSQQPQHYGYAQQAYPGYPTQGYAPPQSFQHPQYPGHNPGARAPNPAANPYNQQNNYGQQQGVYYPPPPALVQAGLYNTSLHDATAQQYQGNTAYNPGAYQQNAGAQQYNVYAQQPSANHQAFGSNQQNTSNVPQANGSGHQRNNSNLSAFSPPPSQARPTQQVQQQTADDPLRLPPAEQRPPPPWMPPNPYSTQRHNSAPSFSTANAFSPAANGNNDDSLPSDLSNVSKEADSLETPYYGAECPYAGSQQDIDPNLSLGEIVYHPALPTRRPLPPTFAQAELEAIAPRVSQPSDHESISDYFINSRRDINMLNVRQTDRWEVVKNDPIFRNFPAIPEDYITPADMRARWRDRPDPTWTECLRGSPSPEPEETKPIKKEQEKRDVLSNLEDALRSSNNALSNSSIRSIDRPRPMGIVRDNAQEDMLARLGVTGSPKMAYQTPGPAYSRNNFMSGSLSGQPGPLSNRPPPPPPPGSPPNGHRRFQSRDTWTQDGITGRTDLHSHNRTASAGSYHTTTGSDFASEVDFIGVDSIDARGNRVEDGERTPRAALQTESRKRGHEEGEDEGAAEGSGAENDTPRPGRKVARLGE